MRLFFVSFHWNINFMRARTAFVWPGSRAEPGTSKVLTFQCWLNEPIMSPEAGNPRKPGDLEERKEHREEIGQGSGWELVKLGGRGEKALVGQRI